MAVSEQQKRRSIGAFSILAVGVVLSIYAVFLFLLIVSVHDGTLFDFWRDLEEGQATVASSLITALGLISSAVILPFVFQDRIASLRDMVDRTEKDLSNLNKTTAEKLDSLTSGFHSQLQAMQEHTDKKAGESDELLRAMYAAVTLQLGQGQVTDSEHADQIVQGLWQRAKFECAQRVDTWGSIWDTTRQKLRSLRQMSDEYLAALIQHGMITHEERRSLSELRALRYARRQPLAEEFAIVRKLQEFIGEFSESNEFSDLGQTTQSEPS